MTELSGAQRIRKQIRQKKKAGKPVLAVAVDDLSQERVCAESGCDLTLYYPTQRYLETKNRFLAGFLPFDNCNETMLEIAGEISAITSDHNLCIGLNGSDPFKNDRLLLKRLKELLFCAIHNYPPIGLVDGYFGANMDRLKLGFDKEALMIERARAEGFFVCCMVRTKSQALMAAKKGADVIIFYTGLGETKKAPEAEADRLRTLCAQLRQAFPALTVLFTSEHLRTVGEIRYVIDRVPETDGYLLMPVRREKTTNRQIQQEIRELYA